MRAARSVRDSSYVVTLVLDADYVAETNGTRPTEGAQTVRIEAVWPDWWLIPLGVVGGLLLIWAALITALWIGKPDDVGVRDAMPLLPDVLRLVKRLASDPAMPRGLRVRLALLLAYLALPIDLIPDVVPILGYADDAIIVVLVLRSVTRVAGRAALDKHWPGTQEGLVAVRRLCRLPESDSTARDERHP